jgi:DNA-binding transcriptional LysR family regulator
MINLRSLDLNLLTVLEAIYEIGTVGGAAGRLALSKSATSHALSRLRVACGDELFVRAGQGLAPTPIASALYPAIKQALEALRTSLTEATGFDPSRSNRRFHLSIPHPLGPFYALDLLAAATAIAPNIELIFDTTSRPRDLEDGLRDGRVDIAIDWLPAGMDPFVNQKLFDDRLVLVARSGHPSVETGATIEDLREQKLVALHPRRQASDVPQAIRKFFELELRVTLHVSELLEIPTIVASTNLIGIFLSSMAPLMEQRLGLRTVAIPLELPAVPIYAVWHESRRNDSAHRWLRELVAAKLNYAPLVDADRPGVGSGPLVPSRRDRQRPGRPPSRSAVLPSE